MLSFASIRPKTEIDLAFLWSVLALLAIGLVMVYSASVGIARASAASDFDSTFYLVRHSIFLVISVAIAYAAFCVPMEVWQSMAPKLILFGIVLLVLVLVIGREINGAQRWIHLPMLNFQPSEIIKLFAVLYTADYCSRRAAQLRSFLSGFLPLASLMVIIALLIFLEPDFGALVVVISIFMGILFLGGFRAGWFLMLFLVLAFVFTLMVVFSPYRRERIFGFLNPWDDPFGRGYQLSHSLIAFGWGEWFGVGLGGSVEKLFYLPEAHTDFLLAVMAEELGFVSVAVVITLFAFIVWRSFAIGWQSVKLERIFPALVAMGIGLWMGMQSFINMGVNMGLLPTKGLTLPLMSYGGSGMLVNCMALAIVLRVDFENRALMKGRR